MEPAKHKKQPLPIHPFLFAVYPVLFLYAENIRQTRAKPVIMPALISLVMAFALLLTFWLVLRSRSKGAIVATGLLVMFFSYGRVVDSLVEIFHPRFRVGLLVAPVWCLLMLAIIWAVVRSHRALQRSGGFLNLVGLILVAIPLIQIISFDIQQGQSGRVRWDRFVVASSTGRNALKVPAGRRSPDIYYIIVDAYNGEEVLRKEFQFDNSEFLSWLEEQGFYVARQSMCNYEGTRNSLPSSLNFGFFPDLTRRAGISPLDRREQLHMLQRPIAVDLLKNAGYVIRQIPSGYEGMQLDQADITEKKSPYKFTSTEFGTVLLKSTMMRMLPLPGWRDRTLAALHFLDTVPKSDRPVFTFAHIIVTHRPFRFRADGSAPDRILSYAETDALPKSEFRKLYVGSLEYANKRLRHAIRRILKESKTPPIIILQADHGQMCGHPYAYGILNAYYLPGDTAKKQLYPTISPVNTFRLVFNSYFGGKYKLLDDTVFSFPAEPGDKTRVETARPTPRNKLL